MRMLLKVMLSLGEVELSFKEKLYVGETGIPPLDWLSDQYHNINRKYYKYKEMISRMLYWGWNMRWSYDFDGYTIYHTLHLKLDRIYDSMLNHSTLVWNSSPHTKLMRELNEARTLAKRLYDDSYMLNYKKFKEKYRRKEESLFDAHRPNAKTMPNKLYSYMARKAFERDRKQKNIERERFYYLLEKNVERWWN